MIICDTNIWYDLTEKLVTANSLQGKLICTHTSLVELTFTHKNYSNPQKVKGAIRAIRDFGVIGTPNVWEFALSLFTDIRPSNHNSQYLWEGLLKLLTIEYEFNTEKRDFAKRYLDDLNKGFTESVDHMNASAASIKAYNSGTKRELRNYDTPTKRYFIGILLQYYLEQRRGRSSLGISLNNPNWNQIELFMKVWEEYYKDLDFHPTQKIQRNDWGDILNMIYVGPNDLYWTNEKKWNRYISQTLPAYQFKPLLSNGITN